MLLLGSLNVRVRRIAFLNFRVRSRTKRPHGTHDAGDLVEAGGAMEVERAHRGGVRTETGRKREVASLVEVAAQVAWAGVGPDQNADARRPAAVRIPHVSVYFPG